jgi:hypothetical protein
VILVFDKEVLATLGAAVVFVMLVEDVLAVTLLIGFRGGAAALGATVVFRTAGVGLSSTFLALGALLGRDPAGFGAAVRVAGIADEDFAGTGALGPGGVALAVGAAFVAVVVVEVTLFAGTGLVLGAAFGFASFLA